MADGGDSGVTVLRFKLNSDSEGATMRDLSIAASGELNDKDAISQVSLYLDGNQSGNAANATHLVSGSYSADNGEIVFDLSSSPVNLQAGDTYFFITYDFN